MKPLVSWPDKRRHAMRIVLAFPVVIAKQKQPLRNSAVSAGDLFSADLAVSLRHLFLQKNPVPMTENRSRFKCQRHDPLVEKDLRKII